MYGKLVTKVNNIATTELVLKTNYETDKSDLEKKYWCQQKDSWY